MPVVHDTPETARLKGAAAMTRMLRRAVSAAPPGGEQAVEPAF